MVWLERCEDAGYERKIQDVGIFRYESVEMTEI